MLVESRSAASHAVSDAFPVGSRWSARVDDRPSTIRVATSSEIVASSDDAPDEVRDGQWTMFALPRPDGFEPVVQLRIGSAVIRLRIAAGGHELRGYVVPTDQLAGLGGLSLAECLRRYPGAALTRVDAPAASNDRPRIDTRRPARAQSGSAATRTSGEARPGAAPADRSAGVETTAPAVPRRPASDRPAATGRGRADEGAAASRPASSNGSRQQSAGAPGPKPAPSPDPAAMQEVDVLGESRRYALEVHGLVRSVAPDVVRKMEATWSDPDRELREARANRATAEQTVQAATRELLGALAPREINERMLPVFTVQPEPLLDWKDKVDALIRRLGATRIPFFATARLEDRNTFVREAGALLSQRGGILANAQQAENARITQVSKSAFERWAGLALRAGIDGIAWEQPTASELLARMPSEGRWTGDMRATLGLPGARAPIVHLGGTGFFGFEMTGSATAPDRQGTRFTTAFRIPSDDFHAFYPVSIDLDEVGGIVVQDAGVVESIVLQLLITQPVGMVRIHGVDPERLGASLNFLYELNPAKGKVLDDVVWTTAEQASRLLVELEQHVTMVTQKYLQGRHSSLTAFNRAAGEVAEPYRVLLLYDYPRMFTRDGRYQDDESIARLHRLTTVGRRAGVYVFAVTPQSMSSIPGLLTVNHLTIGDAPTELPDHGGHVGGVRANWTFFPAPAPSEATQKLVAASVLSWLANQVDARVEPQKVADLAAAAARGLGRGGEDGAAAAHPGDPSTWWRGTTARGMAAHFGRVGSSEVATITFNSDMESSALVGGRTGSGKSSLLHAIVLDLAMRYGPDELELYLVDLKEGVEFKEYGDLGLPQARAIAVDSNREFATSILRALDSEIARRGKLFKTAGVTNLAQYRQRTGAVLPRVLLIMDEFHKLFEREDALRRDAEGLLERVIKEGRAFGVHVILGSQTIALVGSAFRSIANQISYRLVLASSEEDSRILLGEGNPDARLLSKTGEGILNAKNGQREANERFRGTFWSPESRTAALAALARLARTDNFDRRPVVFEGAATVHASSLPADLLRRSDPHRRLSIVVGAPMSLDGPTSAVLDRAPGGNLLLVHAEGAGPVAFICLQLLLAGIRTTMVDFGVFDGADALRDELADAGLVLRSASRLSATLEDAVAELERRIARADRSAEASVLLIGGVHRARALDSDGYAEPGSATALLERLLVEGPEHGMFTIAWADRPAGLSRRLQASAIREFGLKVVGVMGEDDARRLVDTDIPSGLRDGEVLFDDYDRSVSAVLRQIEIDDSGWLHQRLAERASG